MINEKERKYRRTVVDRYIKALLIIGREEAEEARLDQRFGDVRRNERREAIARIRDRLYKLTDSQ